MHQQILAQGRLEWFLQVLEIYNQDFGTRSLHLLCLEQTTSSCIKNNLIHRYILAREGYRSDTISFNLQNFKILVLMKKKLSMNRLLCPMRMLNMALRRFSAVAKQKMRCGSLLKWLRLQNRQLPYGHFYWMNRNMRVKIA